MPIELQIEAALAKKAQTVQKIEGQAALDLIAAASDQSASPPPAATLDGRGALVNTKA